MCVSVQDERACVSECRVSKCVVVSGVQGERDCVSVCVCVCLQGERVCVSECIVRECVSVCRVGVCVLVNAV